MLPEVRIVPEVTDEIVFLSADEEDRYSIAQAKRPPTSAGAFHEPRISVRRNQKFLFESPDRIEYMDVSPKQIVSVSAALIPFLEHDDANRALMGSNMQRQAVPCSRPEAPDRGHRDRAPGCRGLRPGDRGHKPGEVVSADSDEIDRPGRRRHTPTYRLRKYQRSNQSTCIDQRPVVYKGDHVREGTGVWPTPARPTWARWRWARTCWWPS